eukprot:9934952-Alexandrium_andersonii.AAC.1
MSASLVGSEMCIRDSVRTARAACPTTTGAPSGSERQCPDTWAHDQAQRKGRGAASDRAVTACFWFQRAPAS